MFITNVLQKSGVTNQKYSINDFPIFTFYRGIDMHIHTKDKKQFQLN